MKESAATAITYGVRRCRRLLRERVTHLMESLPLARGHQSVLCGALALADHVETTGERHRVGDAGGGEREAEGRFSESCEATKKSC